MFYSKTLGFCDTIDEVMIDLCLENTVIARYFRLGYGPPLKQNSFFVTIIICILIIPEFCHMFFASYFQMIYWNRFLISHNIHLWPYEKFQNICSIKISGMNTTIYFKIGQLMAVWDSTLSSIQNPLKQQSNMILVKFQIITLKQVKLKCPQELC